MARKIYTELLDKGRVTRGWLGVQVQPLTAELAREFSVKDAVGVLVSDVVPDSPAAKARIQRGDVLIEFDGKRLEGPVDLQRGVGLFAPGQSAKVKVWRDQSEKAIEVKVGEAPDERAAREHPGGRPRSTLGLEVRPITPELAQRFNLKSNEGVLDRKSTRLNSSHGYISYAVFCLKKKSPAVVSSIPQRAERFAQIAQEAGADIFVVQSTVTTARHVATEYTPVDFRTLKKQLAIPLIVGNGVTYEACLELMDGGADALLIGV